MIGTVALEDISELYSIRAVFDGICMSTVLAQLLYGQIHIIYDC